MAGVNALTSKTAASLRIVATPRASPVAADRAETLTKALDDRLSADADRVRARLAGSNDGAQHAPSPPGTGLRLDILA